MKQYKKVALAYSGGLDTSIIIPWLKENCGCEVVAVCADVGQGKELLGLEEKAIKTGACKVYIEDLTEEFITDFIYPTMQAGAEYEGKYLLGTSFARPLIAKRLAEIARQEGCDAISHGATGKGNDQVRFELTIKALAPELDIIAPWRVWDIKSREEEIAYAEARGIPVPVTRENNYSMDANIWHLSHEGSDLEDPWNEPKDEMLMICKAPQDAPDEPCYFELSFDRGVPMAIDGETLSPIGMIARLNDLGAENGVGIDDMVENRLVGMKSRGVYENPGGRILYTAHAALETIALDKAVMHYKAIVSHEYADLVYNGMWYSPLREALAAFVAETQKTVTGTARMKLYKGNCICAGVKSPYSLYSEEIATFGESDYDHFDANGFINLFGLPLKVRAMALKDKRL